MAWKKVLFGYRENEVKEYLYNLLHTQETERTALLNQIHQSVEIIRRQTKTLAALRQEAEIRQGRRKEVELRLAQGYYMMLLSSRACRDEGAKKTEKQKLNIERRRRKLEELEKMTAGISLNLDQLLAKTMGQWEKNKKMKNQQVFATGLWGVAPQEVEEYVLAQEKHHQDSIHDLMEKLSQLEKMISAQGREIQALEELLARPDMQPGFIDLAERFLSRFEQMLSRAAQDAALQFSRDLRNQEQENIRRENELRLQITRCRRKINALLRRLHCEELHCEDKDQGLVKSTVHEQFMEGIVQKQTSPVATEKEAISSAESLLPPSGEDVVQSKGNTLRFGYLEGKTAGSDLISNQGEILLKKGQIISLAEAEKVYHQGLLDQLVRFMEVGNS